MGGEMARNNFKNDSRKSEDEGRSMGKSGIGFALWVLAALILGILFIVNSSKIRSNLKATGFFGRVFGKTPAFVENAPSLEVAPADKNEVEPGEATAPTLHLVTEQLNQLAVPEIPETENKEVAAENAVSAVIQAGEGPIAVSDEDGHVVDTLQKMNIKLFFMAINSDGSVVRHEVVRAMPKTRRPLVDAINAIIEGPNEDEEREGCRTLVSDGTKLISASVSNGVASLNFSTEFEFNQYGIEGTRGQLQQIVYTATAFPTVESVQFLIEGEKHEYLGSEGVWIGTPLSRSSF